MLEIKPIFNSLRRSKAGALMLLVQIAITVAIVSNASSIVQDRITYLQESTGYPEDEIFSFRVFTYGTDVDLLQKFQENETLLRNIPGVISATSVSEVPVSGSGSAGGFSDEPGLDEGKNIRGAYTEGDETILNSLGVEVSEGRMFSADEVIHTNDDTIVPSIAIVTRDFIDELFPDGNGLDNTMYVGPNPVKIIGIVDKMKGPWLQDSAADNYIIFPKVRGRMVQKFIVRAEASERANVMKQIEDVMLADYNKRVITGIQGMDDAKEEYNAGDILMMRMLVSLIVMLVLVTALGIFGLTVFNINKRTKQIGTRRALGARKSAIVRYFLVENALICVCGLVLGSAGALYLGQALLTEYSVPELNNWYVAATALFVLVMSLLSVVMPANKAASISPSVATRSI